MDLNLNSKSVLFRLAVMRGRPPASPKPLFPPLKLRTRPKRRRSAMDIAADACGLVKVRVNGKVFYE